MNSKFTGHAHTHTHTQARSHTHTFRSNTAFYKDFERLYSSFSQYMSTTPHRRNVLCFFPAFRKIFANIFLLQLITCSYISRKNMSNFLRAIYSVLFFSAHSLEELYYSFVFSCEITLGHTMPFRPSNIQSVCLSNLLCPFIHMSISRMVMVQYQPKSWEQSWGHWVPIPPKKKLKKWLRYILMDKTIDNKLMLKRKLPFL